MNSPGWQIESKRLYDATDTVYRQGRTIIESDRDGVRLTIGVIATNTAPVYLIRAHLSNPGELPSPDTKPLEIEVEPDNANIKDETDLQAGSAPGSPLLRIIRTIVTAEAVDSPQSD